MHRSQENSQAARQTQKTILEAAVLTGDADAPMKLAVLNDDTLQAQHKATQDLPTVMTDLEKTQNSNEWQTCCEKNVQLIKNRGQSFSLTLGQCTQLLQDEMKQDVDWSVMSASCDPLILHRSIEKTMLAQTEDQCSFTTVHEQEQGFCSFRQELCLTHNTVNASTPRLMWCLPLA